MMEEYLDFPEFIDKVQGLIEMGLYDEALAQLNEYTKINSAEWEIYYLYSRICTEQNLPEEAVSYLHKGLHLDKTNVDCLLGLYYAYSMMNQTKKGSKYLLRAYKLNPENETVLLSLVWYYTEINETQTAIQFFELLQNRGTTNPDAYRNGALAYQRAGQYDNAEQCFKTALKLNPDFDEVRDLLADHYMMLEQTAKAIELYQEALEKSPRNIRILSRLIFCYSQSDQTEHATVLAKESIRLYPNSPIGYIDMAYIHLNLNEFSEAIEYAERALDISPLDQEAFRILALCYSGKKDLQQSKLAFEKAISLDETNSEIIRDYYHHLRESGQYQLMEYWINKAISIESPHCMEDYWFLADYHREKGDDLKSLHYLKLAYKSMPSEKELIPPIVDILIDNGHTGFSIPFLLHYVKKSGWNEVMNGFLQHKRLKGKPAQEGLRCLRFFGQRTPDYRRYIFKVYFRKFTIISSIFLMALAVLPCYLLFGTTGALGVAIVCVISSILFTAIRFLALKEIWGFRKLIHVFS
ncbi:MAG: tetratricopeptide repeat protein [Fibrobacter sp.]|jgi:tetratricopeptide (TPR) repeat protein|nr:tetratricopeptide repeat protein [Fibrobacter sp.]